MVALSMFFERLEELRRTDLFRTVRDRSSPQGSRITIGGKELINFASNDYLGLANHPAVVEAAENAIEKFGFGSGSSRLLGGGSILHEELEEKISRFKDAERALILNSGYSANTGIIPSIAGEEDILFSDELNHASIIDGCRLSRAKTVIYRHRDEGHLEELIRRSPIGSRGKCIIVTDTVFSMDGDIAPLREMHDLCLSLNSEPETPNSVLLYLDDAHGTGVLGKGRGALAHFDIPNEPWIIQMGTFSKALGSIGAFAAGSREAIEWINNTARSFIFSTAIPSCAAAASLKAVDLIENTPDLIARLWSNRNRLVNLLRESGFDTGESDTPIIPLKTKSIEEALRLSQHLWDRGIYAPAIRPPTVKVPRVRITVTAPHSEEDMDALVSALTAFKR